MIPTRHDYYRKRASEHRQLESAATAPEQRRMHARLVDAYVTLARQSRLRHVVRLKA